MTKLECKPTGSGYFGDHLDYCLSVRQNTYSNLSKSLMKVIHRNQTLINDFECPQELMDRLQPFLQPSCYCSSDKINIQTWARVL